MKADKCVWKISLTKLLNITEVVSEIKYPLSSVDITDAVKQMDNVLLYEVSKVSQTIVCGLWSFIQHQIKLVKIR